MIKSGFFRGENSGPGILATAYRPTACLAANRVPRRSRRCASLTGLRGNENVLLKVPLKARAVSSPA
jgi:hypothetical protein